MVPRAHTYIYIYRSCLPAVYAKALAVIVAVVAVANAVVVVVARNDATGSGAGANGCVAVVTLRNRQSWLAIVSVAPVVATAAAVQATQLRHQQRRLRRVHV